MSMNRLRNVAVRMRPPVTTAPLEAERPAEPPNTSAPAQPRRVTPDAGPASGKRQIWDIEAEDSAPDLTHEAQRKASPAVPDRTPHPIAEAVPTDLEAKAPGAGRAKTRILGFHAPDLEVDVFGTARAAPKGPQLPAGFLVVIDGPGRGAYYAVTTSVSSIGRGSDQDVALDFGDESISREGHASVVYDGEQNRFFLGHGNKANVVRRNGTPVLTTEELAHGDLIRIGKTSLRFHAFCCDDFTWSETDPSLDGGAVDE